MSVEAIIASVDTKYVEELEEEYVGYKNQTIKVMIEQIRVWYVITTKEKLSIKAHFFAPWGDTPDAHVTTFARKLDRRQIKFEDHGVAVTEYDKLEYFVSQMYACGLFEEKFLDNWTDSTDK